MTGVQLIGIRSVIDRFNTFGDADAWALLQGKGFIVGGIGADPLRGWLKELEASGSNAIYTLRVYEGDEVPTSKTVNDDYIASIGFKVADSYEGAGISGYNNKLMDRIKALEDKGKEVDGSEDGEESFTDIIMGWLSNPEKLGYVVSAFNQLMGGAAAAPAVATIGGQAMGSLNNTAPVAAASEEGLQRISKSLDILGVQDPDLVAHLEKLAKLSQDEPAVFKAVISRLDLL
jgi:hypothetical protein